MIMAQLRFGTFLLHNKADLREYGDAIAFIAYRALEPERIGGSH
jgi:hypothetical protein